tara:strand:+ start:12955 stop:13722 length:768 start_codon:yes stop_codon:yes gene_type:complete
MILPRIIPTLLLDGNGLYKTRKFKKPKYVGDPINAIRIFNDKLADELTILDIKLAKERKEPNFELLRNMASECFMPLSYGGGVDSVEMVRELTAIGMEKIIINSAAYTKKDLIQNLSSRFGVSTIVGSIDVKKTLLRKEKVFIHGGTEAIPFTPEDWAEELERRGCGEIIINSINRDGEETGYDLGLIQRVVSKVNIPVVASGGAEDINDFYLAFQKGASAVSAGSMFVFQGKHKAVLITYPTQEEIKNLFKNKL